MPCHHTLESYLAEHTRTLGGRPTRPYGGEEAVLDGQRLHRINAWYAGAPRRPAEAWAASWRAHPHHAALKSLRGPRHARQGREDQ